MWVLDVQALKSYDYSARDYKSGIKRKKLSMGPTPCNGEMHPIPTKDIEQFDGSTPKRFSWSNARQFFLRCDLCIEFDCIVNDEPEKVNTDLPCWSYRAAGASAATKLGRLACKL